MIATWLAALIWSPRPTFLRGPCCANTDNAATGNSVLELDRQVAELHEELRALPARDTLDSGRVPPPDMLFIDEPAPGLDQLAVAPGRAVVIVFDARDCVLPFIAGAQLVRCSDPALASRYAMTTNAGRIGPGYAVVDAAGQLRYLTHDAALGLRSERIQILVNALDESR